MANSDDVRGYLILVVQSLLEKHQKWVDDNDAQHVTQEFEAAVNETIEVFNASDIPHSCRGMANAVDALSTMWDRFKAQAEMSVDTNLLPGKGFFKQLEVVRDSLEAATPRPKVALETLPMLEKQGVQDHQICKIYGWEEDSGAPQLWKLSEERAEPGKWTKDLVSPVEKKRQQDEARKKAIVEKLRAKQESKIDNITKPAPESWESLFGQDLSARQIAKMKKVHIDEVFKMAEELGFPAPSLDYPDPRASAGTFDHSPSSPEASRARDAVGTGFPAADKGDIEDMPGEQVDDSDVDYEPAKAPAKKKATKRQSKPRKPVAPQPPADDDAEDDGAGPPSLEEEVMAYHGQGMSPQAIAASISTERNRVTPTQVSKIIAEQRQAAEA